MTRTLSGLPSDNNCAAGKTKFAKSRTLISSFRLTRKVTVSLSLKTKVSKHPLSTNSAYSFRSLRLTRRYKIRIDDVATYLRTLETAPETVAAPVGLFNNKNKCINPIAQIEVRDFQRFLYKLWSAEPDALTPKDVRRLVGYCLATIGQWLTQQKLESVMLPDRTQVIAKRWLVEFISEYIVQNPSRLSNACREIAKQYLEQK